jgi:hypothetical protein
MSRTSFCINKLLIVSRTLMSLILSELSRKGSNRG